MAKKRRYSVTILTGGIHAPFPCHELDVYSILRSLDTHLYIIISIRSLPILTSRRLSLTFDVSRDRLHWDRDNVFPGHHHPRTLSRTKSNMHTCLGGMSGLDSADLEAQDGKKSHLLDRVCRKFFLLCFLVPCPVVVRRVFIVVTRNRLQCICAHLIAQASRFVASP